VSIGFAEQCLRTCGRSSVSAKRSVTPLRKHRVEIQGAGVFCPTLLEW